MYYRNYLIPADIEQYLIDAEPEDKRRLMITGAMRTAGVIERVHTTHLDLGVTVFRFMLAVDTNRDEAKDLVREWAAAFYGITELDFRQDMREKRVSTPDRMYFHVRAQHRK